MKQNNFIQICVICAISISIFFTSCEKPTTIEPEPFVPNETVNLTGGSVYTDIYGNYYQNNTNNCYISITNNDDNLYNNIALDIVSIPSNDKLPANGKYKYQEFDFNTDNSTSMRNANTFGIKGFTFKSHYSYFASKIIFAELNVSDAENGKKYELNIIGNVPAYETDTFKISFVFEGQVTVINDNSSTTAEQYFADEPNTPTTITLNYSDRDDIDHGHGINNVNYVRYYSGGAVSMQNYDWDNFTLKVNAVLLFEYDGETLVEGTYNITSAHFIDCKYGMGGSYVISPNRYWLMSGTLTVSENTVILNAISYFGSTINVTYTGEIY
ncbi:MAG: hypothetical protein LBN95_08140 [Prevotellaceae bacterium]|nr:hypothetical protein [Prevotellaceae bacterium]